MHEQIAQMISLSFLWRIRPPRNLTLNTSNDAEMSQRNDGGRGGGGGGTK